MVLLVVDTAGSAGGVLLARCDAAHPIEILSAVDLHPREFSAELIPAIAELLRVSVVPLAGVDAFVVVSGPGSFTGLRVGLSAVKAMAEATGKPILTLSRLAILATLAAQLPSPESANLPAHIVLDAGRGEFYHGIYQNAGQTCMAETFESLEALLESIRSQPGPVFIAEASVVRALDSATGISLHEIPLPSVRDALPLAVAAWQAGNFQDPARVDANYLRRSDAIAGSKSPHATKAAQPQVCGH